MEIATIGAWGKRIYRSSLRVRRTS